MYKHVVTLLLAVSALYGFEYHLKPVKVAKDAYCFFGAPEEISKANGGNMVNTCFIETKEGFVVIDSGPTFAYASQAYREMQKIAKRPVKYVINTHDHDDHWLGNSFYKSKNALLIGPRSYEQNVVAGMKSRMKSVLGDTLYGKTSIVALDKVVDDNLTLQAGEKHFMIQKLVQKAHTQGDLIVYLPEEKVLFAGDLVFNDRITSLRDGSIIGSIKALNKIDAFEPKVVIGGHGYRTDTKSTMHFKKYLMTMKKEVLEALDNDISIDEVTQKVVMPEFKDMKLYELLHSRNVFDAYRELELYDDEEDEK